MPPAAPMPKPAAQLRAQLLIALGELQASHDAQARAISAVQSTLEVTLQCDLSAATNPAPIPAPEPAPQECRRAHWPGRLAKIMADPELRAFIIARIDRLSFEEIAAEVANHFPPKRRAGKTAIWEWWRKNYATLARSGTR